MCFSEKAPFLTTSFKTEGVHGFIFKGGHIFERLRYTDTCTYTASVHILRSLLVIRSPVSFLDPSAATVEIIGTTQPEEITNPAEGVANEM